MSNTDDYIDMLHKESGELLVNMLAEKDKQISELQKQLKEKDETIQGLKEAQKYLENSASYQIFLDCQNEIENYKKVIKELRKEYNERISEKEQAYMLNDRLGEKIEHLEQELKSQPAEIVEKIMMKLSSRCYGKKLFKNILKEVLAEYKK